MTWNIMIFGSFAGNWVIKSLFILLHGELNISVPKHLSLRHTNQALKKRRLEQSFCAHQRKPSSYV